MRNGAHAQKEGRAFLFAEENHRPTQSSIFPRGGDAPQCRHDVLRIVATTSRHLTLFDGLHTSKKKKKSLGKEERRERKRRDIVIKMMGGRALSLSCQGEEESHDIRQAGRMHAFFSLGDV
mmetsp:Transcript_15720/g.36095  ORF Transcript_15720/g.36095 Transcript_15720/m.36095 type:complete len:121 (+) Transcript_15720:831-1193(+)